MVVHQRLSGVRVDPFLTPLVFEQSLFVAVAVAVVEAEGLLVEQVFRFSSNAPINTRVVKVAVARLMVASEPAVSDIRCPVKVNVRILPGPDSISPSGSAFASADFFRSLLYTVNDFQLGGTESACQDVLPGSPNLVCRL
jgi:hypothetical protein